MLENNIKIGYCKVCGKELFVGKRANIKNLICSECKKDPANVGQSTIRICTKCGRKYTRGSHCSNEFCNKHSLGQIKTLIKYFGFNEEKLGTLEVEKEFNRIRDLIYDLYWNKGYSCGEIGRMFDYSDNIQHIFKYLNIPKRSISDMKKVSILRGISNLSNKSNCYKQAWHISWNGKEVYLRSSYELEYAKYLDEQKINYEVESIRIKYFDSTRNSYRCAIPDFYLPDTNTLVEIKSSWTYNEQEMFDKYNEYIKQGFNFKLILDHITYNTVVKKKDTSSN